VVIGLHKPSDDLTEAEKRDKVALEGIRLEAGFE
jgi:hypothetical protein